jgi:hypothetical protein
VRLARLHPEWDRSCAVCEAYRVDEPPDKRTGLPMVRPKGAPTPCGSCAKVPAALRRSGLGWKDLRLHAEDVTDRSRAAWKFYRECQAVGRFPEAAANDPLVRWYAAVLRDAEAAIEREPLIKLAAGITDLASFLKRR